MKTKTSLTLLSCFILSGAAWGLAGLGGKPETPLVVEAESPAPIRQAPGADGCPDGAEEGGAGPTMVRLPEGFCIDTTEVTRAHYKTWLDTSPAAEQSGACAENDDFTPSCNWPADNNGALPVVCVDWCDAQAYCEAAGKRLCGGVADGGAYAFEDYDDPTVSEWHAACTSGGTHEYADGDEAESGACRSGDAEDYTTWGIGEAGSFAECESPDADYAGVFDLSGNVAEWDNSCNGDDPADGCRFRGGSWQHQGVGLRCAMGRTLNWPRMNRVDAIGFRCCAD